ncbi:MAG: multiheme c-type cytochrome [Gemmatimonadota bacterium]
MHETDARNDVRRAREWRSRTLSTVSALLLFETLSGLSVWALPFSLPNQWLVLLHTVGGLALLIPYGAYQLRHWRRYRDRRLTHVVLTGYFAMAATLVACISGVVLTWQATLGTGIGYGWDLAHVVATFGLLASVLPHLVAKVVHARRGAGAEAREIRAAARSLAARSLGLQALPALLVLLLLVVLPPTRLENRLPEDYSYLYGADRPFAPSLARTSTGQAFDARSLGGSESCGTSGCHEEIFQEWETSAHRYSAMDPAFQTVQKVMAEQNGPVSTRYCGGCHDPISLFSGTKNVFVEDLTSHTGYQEGVSCLVCHAIKKTDVQGNAAYVIVQPARYLFELRPGAAAKRVSDFLIRAYPRPHVEALQHRLFKSPEFCAACHKQFIDEEINQVGWVQLQNQFDNWRKSRWNTPGDPEKTIECRECHMPLTDGNDPASGDPIDYNRSPRDGKHRSHRFLAANQFVPTLLDLPGAAEHVKLTEKWLRGEIRIPEIEDKWTEGPAVPVELVVPDSVAPGEEVRIRAVITNNKVGHEFPTGPLDIIQAWLHVVVTDQDGNPVFETGRRDEANRIEKGSFIFKAEAVDQYGSLIDRHNLWEMVGVRYRRAVFPGFSDQAQFAFLCPSSVTSPTPSAAAAAADPTPGPADGYRFRASGATGELHVSVELLYRKIDQYLLRFLFGEDTELTSPVTVLSTDEATVKVVPGVGS